ncbi:MAG: hypothetical protein M3O20_12515 [Acidobacteriota bacterium]|nr:hypothetical protein [Acidobacteriota bacterium]
MKPLCIDGFAGLGGWAEGFLAENYEVVGFDNVRHDYGTGVYPGQLVLQDWLTLDGAQFKNAAVIVASPPCTEYSYMAMPWSRAKQIAAALRGDISDEGLAIPFPEDYKGSRTIAELNALFDSCFRIQREAIAAAGHYIPLVVENVKGAQPWVGPAKAHYGSFYLWGDVASIGSAIVGIHLKFGELLRAARHRKVAGFNFHQHENGAPGGSFQSAVASIKNDGGSWFAIGSPGQTNVGQNPDGRKVPEYSDPRRNGGKGVHLTSRRENEVGLKVPAMNGWDGYGNPGYKPQGFNVTAAQRYREGVKQKGSGAAWFDNGIAKLSSRSDSRKAASAQIAKIPFPLAQHIARVYHPGRQIISADESNARELALGIGGKR